MRQGLWVVGAALLLGTVTGCSSDSTSNTPAGAKENVVPANTVYLADAKATTTTSGASVQTMPPVSGPSTTVLLQQK